MIIMEQPLILEMIDAGKVGKGIVCNKRHAGKPWTCAAMPMSRLAREMNKITAPSSVMDINEGNAMVARMADDYIGKKGRRTFEIDTLGFPPGESTGTIFHHGNTDYVSILLPPGNSCIAGKLSKESKMIMLGCKKQ
jgi:hypothetical protein